MANRNLSEAKQAKNDEFYTQYADIQKEINAYMEFDPDVFRGKTILLPCDDPEWSNFTKFFAQNFENFGLKKLISTSFAQESKNYKSDWQPTLFETENPMFNADKTAVCGKIFTLTHDTNKNGKIDIEDLEWKYLEGTGDFRSAEVTALRDEADVIITNPPFSLFREFVAWIMEADKKFLIIGNMNSTTVKDIFPLIKENIMWYGPSITSGDREFGVPDEYPLKAATYRIDEQPLDKKGRKKAYTKYIRVKGVRWFTNLDHGRRHEPLHLMSMADNLKFSRHEEIKGKAEYQHYDNYDAIDVPYTDAIPSDYDDAMGVPISFLDKYCPEQYQILGLTQFGCHDLLPDTRKYNDYFEMRRNDDTPTGSSGGKTNENAVLEGKGKKKTYYINSEGRIVHSEYKRVLIRKIQ